MPLPSRREFAALCTSLLAGTMRRARADEKPDDGASAERMKRTLRWTLKFDTKTGADYARQLAALEAILAVPADGTKYLVIRDLTQRPVKLEEEDLKKINRIFWVDELTIRSDRSPGNLA
jgi:hypothetical protein